MYLLYKLPMRCAFKFRKTRAKRVADTPLTGVIEVMIFTREITTEKMFGPYSTGFRTTRVAWDKVDQPVRHKPNTTTPEGLSVYDPLADNHAILKNNIASYKAQFLQAQKKLQEEKRLLSAPQVHQLTMILLRRASQLDELRVYGEASAVFTAAAAQWHRRTEEFVRTGTIGAERSLVEVYQEFMATAYSQINDDQYTRVDEQISNNTYIGYKGFWQLIFRFLKSRDLENIQMSAIRPSFLIWFKEWTLTQTVKTTKKRLKTNSVNMSISFFGRLCRYAVQREYITTDPSASYTIRSGAKSEAKPLPVETLDRMEAAELPDQDRRLIDTWLVAGELCLHYSDAMKLPVMKIHYFKSGIPFINHPRTKQHGIKLKITSEFTPRAIRIIEKYGSIDKMQYGDYEAFRKALKRTCKVLDLRDEEGERLHLSFGVARDSGMTNRAIEGRPARVLMGNAGHSNTNQQEKYINAAPAILEQYLKDQQSGTGTLDEKAA